MLKRSYDGDIQFADDVSTYNPIFKTNFCLQKIFLSVIDDYRFTRFIFAKCLRILVLYLEIYNCGHKKAEFPDQRN